MDDIIIEKEIDMAEKTLDQMIEALVAKTRQLLALHQHGERPARLAEHAHAIGRLADAIKSQIDAAEERDFDVLQMWAKGEEGA